ncbi:hypothetical protein Mal52_37320 [Symmachiella dynata]|uniref:Uncharacterized protein n=1 Tax=Symmachiella dynata TaxID=2527995 RepID=A0A517ZRX9_9PLAN|nr:hypothetical protein [Symmachiella dynata]QDU45241.1 hypothetical protein Mal52_37320 [Symmachiella dynata]
MLSSRTTNLPNGWRFIQSLMKRKLLYTREELLDWRPLVKTQLRTLGCKQQATKRLDTKAHDARCLWDAIAKHPDDLNEQLAFWCQKARKSRANY